MEVAVDKKRTVKKVRSSYLNKAPLESEKETQKEEEAPVALDKKDVHVLTSSIGLIESNGQVRLATHFLNLTFDIVSVKVQENLVSKVVSLILQKKNIISEPWEYTTKRLEDSRELELIIWAERIKKHHIEQPKIMEEYFQSVNSEDLQIQNNLRKAQNKAKLASQLIENRFEYFKICALSGVDGIVPLSLAYTESLINLLGHTIETFVPWVEAKGIPPVSPGTSPAFLEISRQFLECLPLSGTPVQKGPEFSTYIFNEDGSKTEVEVQFIGVIDPVAKGIFLTGYYILKREGYEIVIEEIGEDQIEIIERKIIQDEKEQEGVKQPKADLFSTNSVSTEQKSIFDPNSMMNNPEGKGSSAGKVAPGVKFKKPSGEEVFPE